MAPDSAASAHADEACGQGSQDGNEEVAAARLSLRAAEAVHEAVESDPQTSQAVRALVANALQAARAAMEVAESMSAARAHSRQRQTFAEFTTLLGEEVKDEGIKYAERTIRKAKSLVEDHFQIDEAFRMLGPLRQDSNRARDVHDLFNLLFLIPVVLLNACNWSCLSWGCIQASGATDVAGLWHGEAFQVFWWTTFAYFILDLAFIGLLPQCVKSPMVILQHHVVTLAYIFVPFLRPQYGWIMGACMSVEINTWFLIARRHFNRNGDKKFAAGVPLHKSLLLLCVSVCFYISWFAIRLFLYPYLLYVIFLEYVQETRRVSNPINVMAVTPPMQCVFIFLNVKWTVDLARSKLKGRTAAKGL